MKTNPSLLQHHLEYLKLPFVQTHHGELAQQAAQHQWDHVEYLRRIIEGEYQERRQRVIERRLKAARFGVPTDFEMAPDFDFARVNQATPNRLKPRSFASPRVKVLPVFS